MVPIAYSVVTEVKGPGRPGDEHGIGGETLTISAREITNKGS